MSRCEQIVGLLVGVVRKACKQPVTWLAMADIDGVVGRAAQYSNTRLHG